MSRYRDDRPCKRSDGLLSQPAGDELILFDTEASTAHCLTGPAAVIWNACDGTRTAEELAISAGITVEEATGMLFELAELGLLRESPRSGVGRREALRRFAKTGAVAASAPLIVSAFIDTPLAHASGGGLAQCSACDPSKDLCGVGLTCDPSGFCIPQNCGFVASCTSGQPCVGTGTLPGTCSTVTCGTGSLCCI